MLQVLLEADKSDRQNTDGEGKLPLRQGNWSLLHQGSQLPLDQRGLSPLHLAAKGGHSAVVKVVLASSAHAINATKIGCTSSAVKRDQTADVA